MSIFCLMIFLYLFKYGLVSGVILALKICYSLKFLKFRPFTLFLFYKHCKHTSCRHYLIFVEFLGKELFMKRKRLFAKYSTKWEERQMHRHKASVGIYHVCTEIKAPSFLDLQHPRSVLRRVLMSRRVWKDMLIMHNPY